MDVASHPGGRAPPPTKDPTNKLLGSAATYARGFGSMSALHGVVLQETRSADGGMLRSVEANRRRVRAYIGLGANLGDPRATLTGAVAALEALPLVRLRAVSGLYRTKPVGVTDQPDFLNAAAALDVPAGRDPEAGALALLAALKQIEAALGRQPGKRWGPREIDLDLLLFGDHRIHVRRDDGRWLEVPHPQMRERLFVLAPLAELAPDLRPAGWDETIASAGRRREESEGEGAVSRVGDWTSIR